MIHIISRVPPDGALHIVPSRAHGLHDTVTDVVQHYLNHTAEGGYIGIAPVGRHVGVQLHAADGTIESTLNRGHAIAGGTRSA